MGDYFDENEDNEAIEPKQARKFLEQVKVSSLEVVPADYKEFFDKFKINDSRFNENTDIKELNPFFQEQKEKLIEFLETAIRLNEPIEVG